MKKPLILPHFKNEDEERDFWSKINLADYYEPSDAEPVSFPNLKPSTRSISIRMPWTLIDSIKERANAMDVPYQALIKQTLYNEFVAHDRRGTYKIKKAKKTKGQNTSVKKKP